MSPSSAKTQATQRHRLVNWLVVAAAALAMGSAHAAGAPSTATPAQAQTEPATADAALQRATRSVVGVRAQVDASAGSARTLGQRRAGTGVVIGRDGVVLTIGYLLLEAETVELITHDQRRVPARTLAYDLASGFGLVQPLVPLRGLDPVTLGASGSLVRGADAVVAMGRLPDGEPPDTVDVAVVSQRKFSGYWEYHLESALFTYPPVGAHSGAALLSPQGELLGVGSLFVANVLGDQRQIPGNMFVPVDALKPILAELRERGSSAQSRRAWLGVNSVERGDRIVVARVTRGSPADAAGIAVGDEITAIDGNPVSTLEALYKALWANPQAEREVTLTVRQAGATKAVQVRTVDRMQTLKKPSGI